MKAITILFIFFFALSHPAQAQRNKQAKQLDSLFSMLHAQNQFNGSVLIAEKGKVVLKKGYGYSDNTAKSLNDPETIFELASCTKQFTAGAIVLLKRHGKLSYDDKLSAYIPELAFWDKVTINDLLRHTSGVPDYIADMPKAWDKTKIASNNDLIAFYASRKDTLDFAVGTRHDYSNTNYVLLASIIERVSGKSYGDFLSQNIFKPLKMNNTFVYSRRLRPLKLKNYAIGYVYAKGTFDKVTEDDARYGQDMVYFMDGLAGGAKVNSTVEDVYKWITALKENTFFTKSEFEAMTAVTKIEGKDIRYGYGLDLSRGKDRFAFGHTGSWDGYSTFIYHDVVRDRTIIILQNSKFGAYSFENISQVLDARPVVAEFRKKISLGEAEIKKYAGTYADESNNDDAQIITYLDGHLLHNSKKHAWDIRFFPVLPTEFQAIMQGGNDGVLRFTTLENGDIKLEMMQYGAYVGGGVRKSDAK